MSLEERMAKVEGRLEEISKRIDELRNDLTHRIDELTHRIDGLQSEVRSSRNWTVGLLITMWVTIILAILVKGQSSFFFQSLLGKLMA